LAVIETYQERELLLQIAEGDEHAFYIFFEKYSSLIYPFIKNYTRTASDIEEVIQETFIRVWLNREQLHAIQNIKAWLYKIAARIYLNQVTKENREKEKLHRHKAHFGDETRTPLQHLNNKELNKVVRLAVNKLSEQKRKVFTMSRDQGLKPSEIASKLQMPLSTVKNQLSLALKEIRQHLIDSGYGPVSLIYLLIKIF
jgi:RNA polymerase sigma-70 factor (family 1)